MNSPAVESPALPTNRPSVLATDLDGTLIPLDGHREHVAALQELAALLGEHQIPLVFVTGRHQSSAEAAIAEYNLPRPDWLICDVGTTLCVPDSATQFVPNAAYAQALQRIIADAPRERLVDLFADLKQLTLQEEFKQGPFKLSFYTDARTITTTAEEITRRLAASAPQWRLIHSVDPFNGDGLVDLLPAGVSKAFALDWWRTQHRYESKDVVFAGDSGNDYAAFVAGYHTIVVGNADRELAARVEREFARHARQIGLALPTTTATRGVLDGCRQLGLFP